MSTGPWRCRLKDLFEFAQGRDARESWLGDPGLAARHDVQHPERHFQNPRCLDVFQAAVCHRPAAFYESGMYPYCPAVPRMPGIADFTEIPNMGVVLLTCIRKNATTKVRITFCSSPLLLRMNRSAIWHPLSRTPRRLTPVLQPRRMNILTKRDSAGTSGRTAESPRPGNGAL